MRGQNFSLCGKVAQRNWVVSCSKVLVQFKLHPEFKFATRSCHAASFFMHSCHCLLGFTSTGHFITISSWMSNANDSQSVKMVVNDDCDDRMKLLKKKGTCSLGATRRSNFDRILSGLQAQN